MSKPIYMEKMYAIIFLSLGISFLIAGLLCFMGILKPSAHSSVQSPIVMGTVFSLLGLAFIIVQTVLKIIYSARNKLDNDLLTTGIKLNGTVEKIYLQKYTQYGKNSPYRLCYTYTYQGEVFHHKSRLLWDKPNLNEGDSITVYTNDSRKSTIQV